MTMNVDQARARLAAERARLATPPRVAVRPIEPTGWRPTPTPAENNRKAANPADITMLKLWDKSPIDPWSFDPTTPPLELPPPPTNTAPPFITTLAGLEVGDQVVCSVGTWTGSPTLGRQWLRGGAPIAGEVGVAYNLADDDLGAMIGCVVTATNLGGSAAANAAEVGPVLPAPPPRRGRRNA
jgi:hypothetical protein